MIPTHDRPKLLSRAIDSVVHQQDAAVEILVSDDGSSPTAARENEAVVESCTAARLVRSETATGVAQARNRGANHATGEWLAFLDDDDLWSPEKLVRQLRALDETGTRWAVSGAVWIDGDLDVVGASRPPSSAHIERELPLRNVIPAGSSNVIIDRAAFDSLGGFDPALHHMADWDLWIRCLELGAPAVVDCPDVGYLRHTGNMSLDPESVFSELAHIESKNRQRLPGGKADRAFVYRWVAWHRLARGDRRGAARLYRDCVLEGDRLSALRLVMARLGWAFRRRDRRGLAWASQARSWLDPIRLREQSP